MLFVIFQIGEDRYALEARQVVEVLPLLALTRLSSAPRGVAGMFNYRGEPVLTLDLRELTQGQAAAERLSTRIILIRCANGPGDSRLLGLVVERATETLRKQAADFVDPGTRMGSAPYLGPVFMDGGLPIQWIHEQRLLSEPVKQLLASGFPPVPGSGHAAASASTGALNA